jgi:hypothetical protein
MHLPRRLTASNTNSSFCAFCYVVLIVDAELEEMPEAAPLYEVAGEAAYLQLRKLGSLPGCLADRCPLVALPDCTVNVASLLIAEFECFTF